MDDTSTPGFFRDPALFVHGVLGALIVASLLSAYLIFGRSNSAL
ncbi:MAG: hypothetical protein WCE62_13950 [Polyangiales bacterium]